MFLMDYIRKEQFGNHILICEDSVEGICTAVYMAYELHYQPETTFLQIGQEENLFLFADYTTIVPDALKATKVIRTLKKKFGEEAYTMIHRCLASYDKRKANAIYQTIAFGLKQSNKNNIMGNLTNDSIRTVFELSRSCNNEMLHLMGFLRFQELENGLLFSKIGPKNNILLLIADHFSDRFPNEDFVIYDHTRGICIVHPKQKKWTLLSNVGLSDEELVKISSVEIYYQELFTFFCHKIAIDDRRKISLQQQMLPKRFQKYMIEFEK